MKIYFLEKERNLIDRLAKLDNDKKVNNSQRSALFNDIVNLVTNRLSVEYGLSQNNHARDEIRTSVKERLDAYFQIVSQIGGTNPALDNLLQYLGNPEQGSDRGDQELAAD